MRAAVLFSWRHAADEQQMVCKSNKATPATIMRLYAVCRLLDVSLPAVGLVTLKVFGMKGV